MELPPPLVVASSRLHDFESGSRLEWLETDGRGGYAAGTAVGANTRRYHGILVVARRPPADRVVLLSRLDEVILTADGERFEISANVYPGAIHPQGHRLLEAFALDPWPVWRYRLGALTLTRELFVARDPGVTVVRYRVEGGTARLELRPLIAGREFHALVVENDVITPSVEASERRLVHHPYPGIPPLVLSHDGGAWRGDGVWVHQTVYPRETERGLDDREDLYRPGVLTATLEPGRAWRVACGIHPVPVDAVDGWADAERCHRARAAAEGRRLAGADRELATTAARLGMAAEAFLVEREAGWTIVAGYPWFADWGRDAMISVPGLCLARGRVRQAVSVLETFAAHLRDGLIPNRFPDDGGEVPDDHYNAADASLWFIEAVAAAADAGGDVSGLWPAVRAILAAYRDGTRFGIGADDDALVRQGEPGVQLTWMDARVDGWVVTPRAGKAVEVNALWYNALRRAGELARAVGADAGLYVELADRVRTSFRAFQFDGGGYLYDVIDAAGHADATLRPNQLLAVSLPYSPLTPEWAGRVVRAVERALLIPLGVRTLAPDDPLYRGSYGGSQHERDAAYHQGTAWPWLLGPFITAYLRVHGRLRDARARMRSLFAAVPAHLDAYGMGQIAEVLAGDPPHAPGGCFAQAWSCAELLRVLPMVAAAPEAR
ncbi:MAG TPA: amylo-alpha-1,6-glucosidase [Longimicrobiales bacterium]